MIEMNMIDYSYLWPVAIFAVMEDRKMRSIGRFIQVVTAALFMTGTAWATAMDTETKELLVRDRTSDVKLALNAQTVRCSDIGYGNMQLKATVPDLKWLALLNHANEGEGQPCI